MKNLFKLTGAILISMLIAGAVYVNIKKEKNKGLKAPENPKELIVGTWDGLKPDNNGEVWIFKTDGTMHMTDDSKQKPYKLVHGATHTQCPEIGMTPSSGVYDSDQLVLVVKSSNTPNSCYTVAYLGYKQEVDKILMSLWSVSNGRHFAFEKRK